MPTPTAVLIKLTDEERYRLEAWSRRPKTAPDRLLLLLNQA